MPLIRMATRASRRVASFGGGDGMDWGMQEPWRAVSGSSSGCSGGLGGLGRRLSNWAQKSPSEGAGEHLFSGLRCPASSPTGRGLGHHA